MTSPYPPGNPYGQPAPQQPPYGYPPQAPAQPAGYGYPAQAPAQPAGYGYPAQAPAPAPQAGYPAPPQPVGYGQPAPAAPPFGAPQAPYGQPAYGAPGGAPMGAPMGGPTGAPPGAPTCRVCGGFPAVDATVRGHRGMVIIMQFRRQHGPFCHTCGMATLRDMSAATLWQGWWSYAGWAFTLITLLRNLGPYNKFKALPPPAPGTHGPQLDPGNPLTRRPAIIMLGWPLVAIALSLVLLAVSFATPDTTPYRVPNGELLLLEGDCAKNVGGTADDAKLSKVDCSDATAQFKILGKLYGTTDDSGCKKYTGFTTSFTNSETGNDYVLCMKRLKSGSGTAS